MVRTLDDIQRFLEKIVPGYRKSERNHQCLEVQPRINSTGNSWSGTMGSHYMSIMTAWIIATVPVLILAAAFLVAVERSKPKAPLGSFYSDGQQTNIPLGSAVYSKIPSTQLTFIASFSSTLATAVLPAVMALFSYTIAHAITEDSDTEIRQRLPSPYQLELLISALNGSLLALCGPEGWLIVPAKPAADVDFEATTFGSSTSCEVVTGLCDILQPSVTENITELGLNVTEIGANFEEMPLGDSAYNCKRDRAGLDLAGNFSDLRNYSYYPTAGHDYAIIDYTDSSMSTTTDDFNLRGPTLWYAVLFQVQMEFVTNQTMSESRTIKNHTGMAGNTTIEPIYGLVGPDGKDGNWVSGILSCTTTLSDVDYSLVNGSIIVNSWTAMNSTASFALVANMRVVVGTGWAQFQQGIQTSISNATKPKDIASGWAATYDQTILSQGIGMLLGRPPLSVTQSSTLQVTRIPRAPFVTLLMLDFLYALIGTCLMAAALIAIRKGRGVRDAQARLSTLAVVAESFESPVWGDDAISVDMLFAERRGENTRRIALAKRKDGGRRFKQIVVPPNYVKDPLP
ncbi:MAG: hypothetical protein Q9225_006106 [Loekoesia sp. 1 TL-2023]